MPPLRLLHLIGRREPEDHQFLQDLSARKPHSWLATGSNALAATDMQARTTFLLPYPRPMMNRLSPRYNIRENANRDRTRKQQCKVEKGQLDRHLV